MSIFHRHDDEERRRKFSEKHPFFNLGTRRLAMMSHAQREEEDATRHRNDRVFTEVPLGGDFPHVGPLSDEERQQIGGALSQASEDYLASGTPEAEALKKRFEELGLR